MSENRSTQNICRGGKRSIGTVITSALLLVVIISLMFVSTGCSNKFDYLESDLSEYISPKEDYRNFKLEVDIAKPHEIDVDVAILNMICKDKEKDMLYGGTVTSNVEITPGDVVYIWYRGYLLGDEGEEIAVEGMSNFGNTAAESLEIGGNGFIPGFELNLIGKNISDYSRFEKISIGNVKEGQVAYITYTKVKGDDEANKITERNVRVDLSEDVDAIFGTGFKDKLLGLAIGKKIDVAATLDGTTYSYRDLTVNFVTECETNPIVVEAYFPYDYSKEILRNETAFFEVYVESVDVYDTPEFTDEYLQKKIEDEELNITLEKLNEYEGEKLVDKYRNFVNVKMDELYEQEYKLAVEQAIWVHYEQIFDVKKYPEKKVEAIYEDYLDDVASAFKSYGGQLYDSTTGQYKTYETLDAFAKVYVGENNEQTWKDILYTEAERYVKERMILFYIMKAENLLPSDEDYQVEYNKLYQEYLDEAIKQFFSYAGTDKNDYSEKEYEDIVEECKDIVNSSFDKDYFFVLPYTNLISKTIVDWPDVITLDERRAYPQTK